MFISALEKQLDSDKDQVWQANRQALLCNIHQGKDTLKSRFKLLKWCNTLRRHSALHCVFHHVVVSVCISLKAWRLDQILYYEMFLPKLS